MQMHTPSQQGHNRKPGSCGRPPCVHHLLANSWQCMKLPCWAELPLPDGLWMSGSTVCMDRKSSSVVLYLLGEILAPKQGYTRKKKQPIWCAQLWAFNWLAWHVPQHLASDFPMSTMSISKWILEVEAWVIEWVRVNIEDVGNSNVSPITCLWILNNSIKQMLNDAISRLLMDDLVSTVLEFLIYEQVGSQSLIAWCKNSRSRWRGRWRGCGQHRRGSERWMKDFRQCRRQCRQHRRQSKGQTRGPRQYRRGSKRWTRVCRQHTRWHRQHTRWCRQYTRWTRGPRRWVSGSSRQTSGSSRWGSGLSRWGGQFKEQVLVRWQERGSGWQDRWWKLQGRWLI